MGQKINPFGLRLGINTRWQNVWAGGDKKGYASSLMETEKVRKAWKKMVDSWKYAHIEVQISTSEVFLQVFSHRASVLIGTKGNVINKLQEDLGKILEKKITIKVHEVKGETDPYVICNAIKQSIIAKKDHRFVMRNMSSFAMQQGAIGVRIVCSGRMKGVAIARRDVRRVGSVPLHTLSAHIGYCAMDVVTKSGCCGIKCLVCFKK